jgi:hypothetical protein
MSPTPLAQQPVAGFESLPPPPAAAGALAAAAGAIPTMPPGEPAGAPGVPPPAAQPPWLSGALGGGGLGGNPTLAPVAAPAPAPVISGPALRSTGAEAGSIERAPPDAELVPSDRPIPPTGLSIIGPRPVIPDQPPALPPSPQAQRMMRILTMRGASAEAKAEAKFYLEQEEKARVAEEARRTDIYHFRRQQAAEDLKIWEKQVRERPKEVVEADLKQLEAEKGRLENIAKRIEEPTLRKKYEDEATKRSLEIEQIKHALVKPERIEREGEFFERPPGSEAGSPFIPATGIPPSAKLTETQQKLVGHFGDAMLAHQQLGNSDRALLSLSQQITSAVPIAGNYGLTPQYRNAKNAADAWLLTHIRNVSGAVIGRDEIPQHYSKYFPVPGDDETAIERKRELREEKNRGLYRGLGSMRATGDEILRDLFEDQKAKPVIRLTRPEEALSLPPGRRFIGADGVERFVPPRRLTR